MASLPGDAQPQAEAAARLRACCGSSRWVERMLARRPFGTPRAALAAARDEWFALAPADWLEAFAAHPKIGDREALRHRFAETRDLAAREQAGVDGAPDDLLTALATENDAYQDRFGYIFIVCATGLTAAQMLGLLRARLGNDPTTELRIAAEEQATITALRLTAWLEPTAAPAPRPSVTATWDPGDGEGSRFGWARAFRLRVPYNRAVREQMVRGVGLVLAIAYASAIAWTYVRQPQTIAEVTGGLAAEIGAYRIDAQAFADGLAFFHKDQFVEARSAFARADPAAQDARTQFYVAYSYYRQGWGRIYSDDALFTEGLKHADAAIALAPSGRLVVDDEKLLMHSADELRAELQAGLRRDASDFNPLRVMRQRK